MSVKVRWKDVKGGGRSFYLDIHHAGRRKKVTVKATTLQEAKKKAAAVERQLIEEGWPDSPHDSLRLDDFTGKYLIYSHMSKAYKTYISDRDALKAFQRTVGNPVLTDVTQEHFEQFRMESLSRIKPTSVNVALRHLKAAFSWATENGLLKSNPTQKVKLNRVPKNTHPRFLSATEIDQLRAAIGTNETLRRVVDFALQTGLRRNEVVNLKWLDVDLDRNTITVRNSDSFRTKSGRSRVVPVSSHLRELLLGMGAESGDPDGLVFPINYWTLGGQFAEAVERAKLPGKVSFHVLRHTFASHLTMSGVDLASIQQILGHHDISVTMIYAHLSPEHLARTVDKLPY